MTEATYERYEGQEATGQLDAFLAAYGEVYADPPYREGPRDVAEFIDRHGRQIRTRPGFRLVLAHDGGDVVGFTYGYRLPADTGWGKTCSSRCHRSSPARPAGGRSRPSSWPYGSRGAARALRPGCMSRCSTA